MNKIPVSYVLRSYPYFLLDIIGLILAGIVVQMSIDWHLALRQGIWALAGVGIFFILVNIPYKTILKHSLPFYGFLLALLILVKVAGHQSHGARRWIGYGPVMIQPSEFMKLALVLALVWVFGKMDGKEGLSFGKVLLATSMAALPGILIAKQPDLGTAIGLFFCLGVFLFLRGIRSRTFFTALWVSVILLPIGWQVVWNHLQGFQKDRIRTFLNPESDPSGLGYHTLQSMVAVGSGGWFGQGLKGATQVRFRFLPGAHTDFAFAVFSEEWGLVGAAALLLANAYILWFGYKTAVLCHESRGFFLAAGLTSLFGISFLVNASMVVGILPVVGIPMPLLSYGGSALLVSMMGLALILNVRTHEET
ncbi:MAG: FtsW/RodA/SpoVE family cell cycle protein [Leptospirillum sp.]